MYGPLGDKSVARSRLTRACPTRRSPGRRAIINEMPPAPSTFTRRAFREWFVGTSLAYIDDQFSAVGIAPGEVPLESRPSGQRRARVEEHYAAIDWNRSADVHRVLRLYEHILSEANPSERARLEQRLRADGYVIDAEGRIVSPRAEGLEIDTSSLEDPEAFRAYERRILESVESQPDLAIGSAKELLEATCKLLMEDAGIKADEKWSVSQLFKQAAKTLDLSVDSVAADRVGAEEIRRILAGLSQIVSSTAELRNRFGTGHGRHRRVRLGARHARLVAGAALTVVRFLLDTRAERRAMARGT